MKADNTPLLRFQQQWLDGSAMNHTIDARNRMHRHLMNRLIERRIPLDYLDVLTLERRIEKMHAAFVRPDQNRYRLTVTGLNNARYRVVYDARHRCLLTIWPRPTRKRAS